MVQRDWGAPRRDGAGCSPNVSLSKFQCITYTTKYNLFVGLRHTDVDQSSCCIFLPCFQLRKVVSCTFQTSTMRINSLRGDPLAHFCTVENANFSIFVFQSKFVLSCVFRLRGGQSILRRLSLRDLHRFFCYCSSCEKQVYKKQEYFILSFSQTSGSQATVSFSQTSGSQTTVSFYLYLHQS